MSGQFFQMVYLRKGIEIIGHFNCGYVIIALLVYIAEFWKVLILKAVCRLYINELGAKESVPLIQILSSVEKQCLLSYHVLVVIWTIPQSIYKCVGFLNQWFQCVWGQGKQSCKKAIRFWTFNLFFPVRSNKQHFRFFASKKVKAE